MDIKKEIEENFILDLHQKRKKSTKKKLAHHPVFDATKYSPENAGKSSEFMKFGYLYSKICGYKIRNFESIENAFKLMRIKLDDNFRFHRCFRFFKRNELSSLSEYVIRNGKIKDDNFSISPLNPYEIQISIHSGKNEELCNLEMFNRGIEQIREILRDIDDISIVDKLLLEGFLRREEFTVELGNKVIYPELEEIKKDFVIGKWYNIYKKLSYQFDTSWGKLELDFRFNIRLNDLVKVLNFTDNFKKAVNVYNKLNEKYPKVLEYLIDKIENNKEEPKVIEIESFDISPNLSSLYSISESLSLEYKYFNEIKEFNELVKSFLLGIILRDSKIYKFEDT